MPFIGIFQTSIGWVLLKIVIAQRPFVLLAGFFPIELFSVAKHPLKNTIMFCLHV